MTHASGCFRSDGDWFCAHGCTHERDQEHAALVAEVRELREKLTESERLRALVYEQEPGYKSKCRELSAQLSAAERARDEAREALRTLRDGMRDYSEHGMGETLPVEYEMPTSTNKRVRALIDAALAKPDGVKSPDHMAHDPLCSCEDCRDWRF